MRNSDVLFLNYSRYLREKYGETAYRVAVDAGFSCPNRGMDRSSPGCIYCDERGSRAVYLDSEKGKAGLFQELQRQVEGAMAFLKRRYDARVFLLYFQAFSNTFASPSRLRKIYDYTLSLGNFRELIVSTRPDCISKEISRLLSDYINAAREVWVELGLQSASNTTLERINRGHTVEEFFSAFSLLRSNGIKIAVHLIFGLPGESEKEILNTIRCVAALRPEGIKIHNLHVPKGTRLYSQYLAGELSIPGAERHLDYVVKALELLPPATVIMRLTCDTPDLRRAAPRFFLSKSVFYEKVKKELRRRNTWQGRLFNDNFSS
ncbi:MAG: TIGR01212 family radical SAM protein [Spirochaetota bacterium]